MKTRYFRTFALIGAVGAFAAACSDAPTQLQPNDEDWLNPAFATFTLQTVGSGPDEVNGSYWWTVYDFGTSVGTGSLKPFLRLQADPTERGFNTDGPAPLEAKGGTWTHSLPLNRVPAILEPAIPGGATWREFFLDANENNSGLEEYFSIDILQIWICHDGTTAPASYTLAQFNAAKGGVCQSVWDLDVPVGNTIHATDGFTQGSGNKADYRFLIPASLFGNAANAACPYTGAASTSSCGYYVIFYSELGFVGGDYNTSATFEEYSTLDRPVPGTLQLVKRVVNDNGGTATVTNFGITSSAGAFVFDGGVADGANTLKYTSQAIPLAPGSYTFGELDVAGYTEGTWSCTGATATGTVYNGGSVTVADGQTIVCTITNNDDPGSLQLVKRIVNDNGGTAVVGAFGITWSAGGSPIFGGGVADGANTLKYTSNAISVNAGSYNFAEIDVAGYGEGTWACSPTAASGTAYNAGSVTVGNGVNVVCTITNDDSQGSLQIIKRVVNDNGGTATHSAFGLATNAGALAFDGGSADGANTIKYTATAIPVNAGSYTLRENDIAGYTEGTWSCTGATPSNNTISAGAVTVPNGVAVVCTITNNDIAPQLTLNKITSYSYGGTRPESDWTLTANGGAAGTLSGPGAAGSTDVVSDASFKAGTYALSESGPFTGYQNGSQYSCVKNGAGAVLGNSITLAVGDVAVCSITNTDSPASLQIIKRVVNDNGGTATVSAFGVNTDADGAANLAFDGGSPDGDNTIKYTATAIPVAAGSYTLRENDIAGYSEGTWSCTGATPSNNTISAGAVTVPFGGTVVCTITNNDIAPSLTLNKITSYTYGGTRPESDWTLIANKDGGAAELSGAGAPGGTDVQSGPTFQVGTYALSETGTYAGYQNGTQYSCVKNGAAPVDGNSITLALADVAVCSITNTDLPATLRIVKNTVGGNRQFDYARTTPAGAAAPFSLTTVANTANTSFTGLSAGAHTVTETVPAGWDLTGRTCVNTVGGADRGIGSVSDGVGVTLAVGDDVTCTFTNTELGTLIVQKVVTGGDPMSFPFTRSVMPAGVDGSFSLLDGGSSSTGKVLTAGSYQVCETNLPGGWQTPTATVNGSPASPNGNSDSGIGLYCWTAPVTAGGTTTVIVTNEPPPGGGTRTIGYWKNWSSCDGKGKQWEQALDRDAWGFTLDGNLGEASPIGLLTFVGATEPDENPDCMKAINILSKNAIDGSKRPGDAAYNLAAQFLGAKLNIAAGAGSCTAADNAMTDAQTLLVGIGFDGTGEYLTGKGGTKALANQANSLASILDDYNNGGILAGCPAHF